MRRLILASLLLGLYAQASQACRMAPEAQLVDVDQQLRQAVDVSLARVVRVSPLVEGGVEYEFEVARRYAGWERSRFVIRDAGGMGRDGESSYQRHQDPAFWRRGGGRTMNGPDCVIHPTFTFGNYYLVFLGQPAVWRSFERVETVDGQPDLDDQWLQYVSARLVGPGPPG
ncbi:hypothetical protein ACLB1G_23475 [Oxalobacteraceae bacterium A2-2]